MMIKGGIRIKLKKLLCFVPVSLLLVSLFSGCSSSERKCTMTVITSYGGSGIDGEDLGSGTFSEEFSIKNDDIFYEDFYGRWYLNPKDPDMDLLILEVKKVETDGVTAIINNKEKKLSFSSDYNVASNIFIADGTNYSYKISFSDISEKSS